MVAKCDIGAGTVFCYEGPCQARAEVNIYTLALPAISIWGESAQVIYVDGSPTPASLIGGMNEFVWDARINQFEFAGAGLVRALRDVKEGDECFIAYGEEYDWDEYKIELIHNLGACVSEAVGVFGHASYIESVSSLVAYIYIYN